MEKNIQSVLLSEAQIQQKVRELAAELSKEYADKKGIVYKDMPELLKKNEIMELFREHIDTLQQQFAHYEQIKKFTLLAEPFSMAKGELTNTLKIKRSVLNKNYAAEIEAMYAE